jgi:hypothetical protein
MYSTHSVSGTSDCPVIDISNVPVEMSVHNMLWHKEDYK